MDDDYDLENLLSRLTMKEYLKLDKTNPNTMINFANGQSQVDLTLFNKGLLRPQNFITFPKEK